MPRAAEFETAVGRNHRLDRVGDQRKPRTGLDSVQLRCDVERASQIVRTSSELVGELQQNPANLFGFLLLEFHDLVVDFDGLHRLDEQAGAAG